MESIKEIKKRILSMVGEHSQYEIFCDWITMVAYEIANTLMPTESRKETYSKIKSKYSENRLSLSPI